MYRGNRQNTGVYDTRAARRLSEQPNWIFQAGSPITGSPVTADGSVYFGTKDGNLFAIDTQTGTERWHLQLGRPCVAPPEIIGGSVYCATTFLGLITIDAQSGIKAPLLGNLANLINPSPPALLEEVMYISADSGHYALDVSTGQIIRSFAANGLGSRRPVVGSGTVSFGSSTWVDIMDLESGQRRTRVSDGVSLIPGEICLHNDSFYFFVWMGYHLTEHPEALPRSLMALTPNFDRNYLELPQDSRTSPAAADGTIYFGGDRGFYAVDIQAVSTRWEFAPGAPMQSSPSIAEDLIYFGSDDGNLYVLNKDTGELVKKLATVSGKPVRTSPAICDGVVYFADSSGNLYSWGSPLETSADNDGQPL